MESKNQWLKDLGCDEQLWAKELNNIPSMIYLSYVQLNNLAKDGQVYGVMLQCKDVYEMIIKIPVIMSLIIINSDARYKEGSVYSDIMRASLGAPMSMGLWRDLATDIVKKDKELHLPNGLINILKCTKKLYATEVTSEVSDVVNWRNKEIGHGATKFEDDESYRQEVASLIAMLKKYFDGGEKYSVTGLYDTACFELQGERLVADKIIMPQDQSRLSLVVDSVKYAAENYVNAHNLKCYLFDSYYSRKSLIKYSSYIDGKSEERKSKYFADLYERYVFRSGKDFDPQSKVIRRGEDSILECLNAPMDYIKPQNFVKQLTTAMDDIEHGVIAVFMERGTGKTAFSNQMSGLYTSTKDLPIRNSLSRCYHVQNAAIRGVGDFINSVNFSFTHSHDSSQDLRGGNDEMPQLTNNTDAPADYMARFLNYYHEVYGKEYTILVIDGIDEVTEQTQRLLDFLPDADQLDDGVFVLLLSRFKNEDTVLGNSKKYIELAESISQRQIRVNRTDEENVRMLKECIDKEVANGRYPDCVDCDELIIRADYRFLYLKAYLAINPKIALDNKNEYNFISSYINYILSFHSESQKQRIKEIAVTIALFPSMSIRKYQEYMNWDITYKFVGMLNDLLPLMTVLHIDGEDIYSFADAAYAEFVLKEFSDVAEEVMDAFYKSLVNDLSTYLKYGELIRIIDQLRTEPEDITNNRIIFYSEGIIGIWNRAIDNKAIREKFFSESYEYGLTLCGHLYMDSWAKTGYGYYVRQELINCVGATLYYCLKNRNDVTARAWSHAICVIIRQNDRRKETQYSNLEYALFQSNDFSSIYDYIIVNAESLRIEDWFWVLKIRPTDNTIKILKSQEGLMDNFIDYLVKRKDIYLHRWTDILAETELTSKQEETILNLQLQEYISGGGSHKGKTGSECAKECLEKIREKGYRIDENLIAGDVDEIIKHMENGDLKKVRFRKEKEEAVRMLLDFDTPWHHDPDECDAVYNAYSSIRRLDDREAYDHDVTELHTAFFKRMCFEYESGDLAYFVESEILLDDFIVDILKNELGHEESFYAGLRMWIDIIRDLSGKNNKRAILLLPAMMIEGVNWLNSHDRTEEAKGMLEEYIYNIDTQAFFSSYYDGGIITSAIEPDIIYRGTPMVYCTQNAIYLLDYYLRHDLHENFEMLMNRLEKDIPIIDRDHKPDKKARAMCEIAKFRFMKYRQSLGYTSQFDDDVIKGHTSFIDSSLRALSRNSDYNAIALHIELLMEYAWQTQNWSAGRDMCDDLIGKFEAHDNYDDPVVKQSIERQLNILRRCKQFFLFISGENYTEIDKSDHIYMRSGYYLLGYRTIYDVIGGFWRTPPQKRNPENYIHNDPVVLEAYQ